MLESCENVLCLWKMSLINSMIGEFKCERYDTEHVGWEGLTACVLQAACRSRLGRGCSGTAVAHSLWVQPVAEAWAAAHVEALSLEAGTGAGIRAVSPRGHRTMAGRGFSSGAVKRDASKQSAFAISFLKVV